MDNHHLTIDQAASKFSAMEEDKKNGNELQASCYVWETWDHSNKIIQLINILIESYLFIQTANIGNNEKGKFTNLLFNLLSADEVSMIEKYLLFACYRASFDMKIKELQNVKDQNESMFQALKKYRIEYYGR